MFKEYTRYEQEYSELMDVIKDMNIEYQQEYIKSKKIKVSAKIVKQLFRFQIDELKKQIIKKIRFNNEKKISFRDIKEFNYTKSNYFSEHRIAIYTSIFGKYDNLIEPKIKPNNCDYYIITDNDIPKNSAWKKIDANKFIDIINKDNIYKNRYFKMNPEKIFSDYKYSIYIDGNIQVVTDLTEFVNKINPEIGIAMHLHSMRQCISQESKACAIYKKENENVMNKQIQRYFLEGMPLNFGLLQASVIVREHNNSKCKKIMRDWWNEFNIGCKRDQISLPYVIWKNGLTVSEIGVLGNNIAENYSLRIFDHR